MSGFTSNQRAQQYQQAPNQRLGWQGANWLFVAFIFSAMQQTELKDASVLLSANYRFARRAHASPAIKAPSATNAATKNLDERGFGFS